MQLALTIAQVNDPLAPFILQNRPFTESIRAAAQEGYQGVEIQLGDPRSLDRESFFDCCRQNGIHLVSIATGPAVREGLSLSSPDEKVRLATVERIRELIDFAAACPDEPAIMIGMLSGRVSECPDDETFFENLGKSLRDISRYGEEKKVPVNVEPVNHLDNPGLNTWERATWLLDRFGCGHIRLGLDLYHMWTSEEDVEGTIIRYGSRIGCVQLMEKDRRYPVSAGAAGSDKDRVSWERIARIIRDTGYDGPVIMECLPAPDPQTALRGAAKFYREFWEGFWK